MTVLEHNQHIVFKADKYRAQESLVFLGLIGLFMTILGLLVAPLDQVLRGVVLILIGFAMAWSVLNCTDVSIDAEHAYTRTMYLFARKTIPIKGIHRIEVLKTQWNFTIVPSLVFYMSDSREKNFKEYNVNFYSKEVIGKIISELKKRNPAIALDESTKEYW